MYGKDELVYLVGVQSRMPWPEIYGLWAGFTIL